MAPLTFLFTTCIYFQNLCKQNCIHIINQSTTAILKSILFTENINSLVVGTGKQAKHNY